MGTYCISCMKEIGNIKDVAEHNKPTEYSKRLDPAPITEETKNNIKEFP